MVITGHNFGRTPPIVRLGNQVLSVKSYAPNQAVVGLPPRIRPATYRLTVTTDGPHKLTSEAFSAVVLAVADRQGQRAK
ncbi:MAG: IPT/TIG domain-containing protein [Gammaproteobacteria bacterium]